MRDLKNFGYELLTYLGVNVGDVATLFRIMALVNGISAVKVLANNLSQGSGSRGGIRLTFHLLSLDS